MTNDLPLAVPLNYLPEAIREPSKPARAVGTAWLLTFPVSIVLAMLIAVLMPKASQPEFPFTGAELFVRLVIVAPIVETLIMGVVLVLLQLLLRPTPAVLVTALFAGLAHSLAPNGVPVWGLVIWWPFLIFSTLFVTWRQRSLLAAFAMPALAHAVHNLPTALLVAYGINV
jgi:hypothetical protein